MVIVIIPIMNHGFVVTNEWVCRFEYYSIARKL